MLVFTDTLEDKLEKINTAFRVIDQLFTTEGIEYYATLPQAEAAKRKFAKEFCEMTKRRVLFGKIRNTSLNTLMVMLR